MKLLVVNADDLGADRARNHGIFDAVRAGAVTSVSVLANGPAFTECLEPLAELADGGLSVGLHLNLSEGSPLARGLRLLTGGGAQFRGKWVTHALLDDPADVALGNEVRREIAAQLASLKTVGIEPDHLDGHQHVHLWPVVLGPALEAARNAGIRWFRVPYPSCSALSGVQTSPTGPARFAAQGARARSAVRAAGLHCVDQFLGLDLIDRVDEHALCRAVAGLGDGVTELMVHPGRVGSAEGPFSSFSSAAREAERSALVHPQFIRALAQAGAVLGPFPRTNV